MIKVLHVVGKLGLGGAETRLMEMSRFADKSKFYFDFCVFEDGDYDDQVRQLGYGIVKFRLTRNIFSFNRHFSRLLRAGKYDAVHSHIHHFSGLPLWLAAKAKVPIRIMHIRISTGAERISIYRSLREKFMCKLVKKHATKIVAVSEYAMSTYMGAEWKQDPRAEVLYNGLDISPFLSSYNRSETLAEFGISSSDKVVIHVGNFHPAKDHKTLINSAEYIICKREDVHFLLVGSGTLMAKIRKMVSSKGLNTHIHFLGSRNDVPRLLMASDVFLFPSIREGLPGAVLEALAAGLPVVASDIGEIREIASQSDSIRLVPTGDASGFAQKLQEILADLQKCRKKPRQIPERFRFENYVQKMFSLYEHKM